MDHFEHVFVAVRRHADEEDPPRNELQITREEAAVVVVRLLVLRYFSQLELPLKEEVEAARRDLTQTLKHWLPADLLHDIYFEFRILIREGSQCKLKLNLLKMVFDEQFTSLYDIVALTHDGYF